MKIPMDDWGLEVLTIINDTALTALSVDSFKSNAYNLAVVGYWDAIHRLINRGSPLSEVKSFHREMFQQLRCGRFDLVTTPLSKYDDYVQLQARTSRSSTDTYAGKAKQPNNNHGKKSDKKRERDPSTLNKTYVKNKGQCENHPAEKSPFIETGHTTASCFRNKKGK